MTTETTEKTAENAVDSTAETATEATTVETDQKASAVTKRSPLGKKGAAKAKQGAADTDTAAATDSDAQSTVENSAAPKSPLTAKPAGTRLRVISAVLAALLVIALGVIGYLAYEQYGSDNGGDAVSEQMRTQAVETASDYAIKLSSFDYRDLNKNKDSIASMSTSDFASKYSEMVSALTEIVTNGKGEATAEVPHAAVESISDSEAKVVLFVNQTAKNVVAPEGKNQPYRMLVSLKRSDDRWLVDNVETI